MRRKVLVTNHGIHHDKPKLHRGLRPKDVVHKPAMACMCRVLFALLFAASIPLLKLSLDSQSHWHSHSLQRDITLPSTNSWLTRDLSSLPNPSGYCPTRRFHWNSTLRKDRFPLVEERVCLYMTRWYDPNFRTPHQWKPQLSFHQVHPSILHIYWNYSYLSTIHIQESNLEIDTPFFLFSKNLTIMQKWAHQKNWIMFVFYAMETENFCTAFQPDTPVLMAWGDQELKTHEPLLPVVAKWRFNNLSHHTRPVPIVIPLEGGRHYDPLQNVEKNDIPWAQKKNMAVWRGHMSGISDGKFVYDYLNSTNVNPLQVCMRFPRCRLVYRISNSTLADVGFNSCSEEELKHIQGIHMVRPKLTMKELLQFKMLISIEGNDVASGLKWNLLSNSVVLMPPPLKSIFSMEFLLEPWVHYVPLDIDNVEHAIQWVNEHDDEAQRISQRATNFIHDLFFHPDASNENDAVIKQIVDRISALWKNNDHNHHEPRMAATR